MLAEPPHGGTQSSADPRVNDLLAKAWAAMVRIPIDRTSPALMFEEILRFKPKNFSANLGYAGTEVLGPNLRSVRSRHTTSGEPSRS